MKIFEKGETFPEGTITPRLTPELKARAEALVDDLYAAGFQVALALDGPRGEQVPTWLRGKPTVLIKRLARTISILHEQGGWDSPRVPPEARRGEDGTGKSVEQVRELCDCDHVLLAEYMEDPGGAGSFFKTVAEAIRRADPVNLLRLYRAFPEELHGYLVRQRHWAKINHRDQA